MTSDYTEQGNVEMGYQATLMHGNYTYGLAVTKELREMGKQCRKEKQRERRKGFSSLIGCVWHKVEDWVFLALLGIIVALIIFAIDYGISQCNAGRMYLFRDLYPNNVGVQYALWVSMSVILVLFSVGFVYLLAPQASGSAIPEMKVILRGVVLKEYLTLGVLVAKVVGLTAAAGSGIPLSKEGPAVHIASIVATLMSKMVASYKGIFKNESRNKEMLAAACAVGVSCSVGAPIGGVLFGIEVTAAYFSFRNYWRAFLSSLFAVLMSRLLFYWVYKEATLTMPLQTYFQMDFPYDPLELSIYALIGVAGGLLGALYIWCHRKYVLFIRKNKKVSSFLQKSFFHRLLYPFIVSLLIASLLFPPGPTGRYLGSALTSRQQMKSFFSNITWSETNLTAYGKENIGLWMTNSEPSTIFPKLSVFILFTFIFSILASTLPLPVGSLTPMLQLGAAFGRLVGEAMHLWFPQGIRLGTAIIPGSYAIVGAAAFSTGVTHSISICILISEMTGQIRYILPVMVAVAASKIISTLLQPSIYESISRIKKLPYLPDILFSGSTLYEKNVEDFMLRDIKCIWNGITYGEIKQILVDKTTIKVRSFPLVDNPDSMILLGSIQRKELVHLIDKHLNYDYPARFEAIAKSHLSPTSIFQLAANPLAQQQEAQRKILRFQVVPVSETELQLPPDSGQMNPATVADETAPSRIQSGVIKSILKRSNSWSGMRTAQGLNLLPATTVTGMEGHKIRQAIEQQRREEWQESEMKKAVDLKTSCRIDPAPFQLVERTSLLKAHSMFFLLGISHAYVTAIGKLIGVVSLKELRKAIENVNSAPPTSNVQNSNDTESRGDIEAVPDPNGSDESESEDDVRTSTSTLHQDVVTTIFEIK